MYAALSQSTTRDADQSKDDTTQASLVSLSAFANYRDAMALGNDNWWKNMWKAAEHGSAFVTHFPGGFVNGAAKYVKSAAKDAWAQIKSLFTGEAARGLYTLVRGMMLDPWNQIKKIGEALASTFKDAYNTVSGWLNDVQKHLKRGNLQKAWRLIGSIVGYVLAVIVLEFSGAGPAIARRIGGAFTSIAASVGKKFKRKPEVEVITPGGRTMKMEASGNDSGAKQNRNTNSGGFSKPKSWPSHKKVKVDAGHSFDNHHPTGQGYVQSTAAGGKKDVWPTSFSVQDVEQATRLAYKNVHTRLKGQRSGASGYRNETRYQLQGTYRNMTIEFWYNAKTKTIETAYPKP